MPDDYPGRIVVARSAETFEQALKDIVEGGFVEFYSKKFETGL